MSILEKSNEELFDFSDVDEGVEFELDQEEDLENYKNAVNDFLQEMHPKILDWFDKNHPKVNELLVLREWIDAGLIHSGWDPEEIFELTTDNINTYYDFLDKDEQ